VKKEIVKIPKDKIVVTLGRAEPVAGSFQFEKYLAIYQQRKKLNPGKGILAAQPFALLRRGQCGQGGRNARTVDFEQRIGARRFQDHLIATPSHVSEARKDESVGIAKRRD